MKNRTIFTRDNLEILRGMDSESVDLIYLDPPYNSNRNYAAPIGSEAAGAAFRDTWTLSDLDVAWIGEIGDRSPAVEQIIHGAGLAHSKGMQSYLVMMAVRLFELRRVLAPTGSIYLHVDPTASHYLEGPHGLHLRASKQLSQRGYLFAGTTHKQDGSQGEASTVFDPL